MIISIVEKISEKKSWIIVWSEMQMFLTQFWWFPPHHFTFEVTWKNWWLSSFNWRLFLPSSCESIDLIFRENFENGKAFDYKESRLDDFFFQKSTLNITNGLKSIFTLVLVISHEQSRVERGFNTKNSISQVNLSEKSMVSRKMIIDHVQKKFITITVKLTSKFFKSVKCAR